MVDPPTGRKLPEVEPARLRAAVHAVLAEQRAEMPSAIVAQQSLLGRLPSTAQLRRGAEESVKDEADDALAAEYFQSLLELGYLVASANGLADDEREALALLVEHATDAAVDRDTLDLHFRDLDATSEALGRRERLVRVAANLETVRAREEAIGFATLTAIADGELAPDEMQVLLELGQHFSLSADHVETAVEHVASNIERALQE